MTEINKNVRKGQLISLCDRKTGIKLFIFFLRSYFVIKIIQTGILFPTLDLNKITKDCRSVTTVATILPQMLTDKGDVTIETG